MTRSVLSVFLLVSLAAVPTAANAQSRAGLPPPKPTEMQAASRIHRVVVQVTQNDPALMTTILNNVDNMARHYEGKNERLEVELVAYGPGLHMMRTDTSPVKARLSALATDRKGVTLSGCANTMAAQSKQDGLEVSLLPEAKIVPAGIARIVELQEQGWVYVRP